MERIFIETYAFKKLIDQLNNKELEKDIKEEILKDPLRGDIISGTGGIRKLRVANKMSKKGKSSSFRVLYFDLPDVRTTFLILVYGKSDIENISAIEIKEIKALAEALKNEYKEKN